MSAEAARGGVPSGTLLRDRYRVESRIGSGGLGVVYEGVDVSLGRPVAIKILHRDVSAITELRQRFEREARALAALTHPHIVSISDFGVHDEVPFLVMERLTGTTLDTLIAEHGPLEPERALAIGTQIIRALAFAHSRGVVHRDLKPSNVFVMQQEGVDDYVKVIDFGLAKFLETDEGEPTITQAGTIFGTPAYMAPEQASGGRCDARTDVYAAGVLLFELLAGRRPFLGSTRVEVIRGHLIEDPPTLAAARPGLLAKPELEALVARALAKAPRDRPPDAGALLDAIEALPPFAARLDPAAPSLRPPPDLDDRHETVGGVDARRRVELLRRIDQQAKRKRIALIGAIALVLTSGGVLAWWGLGATGADPDEATRTRDAAAPVPVRASDAAATSDTADAAPPRTPDAPDARALHANALDAATVDRSRDAASPDRADSGAVDTTLADAGAAGIVPDDGSAAEPPDRLPLGPGPTLPSPWVGDVPARLLRPHQKLRSGATLSRAEQQDLFRYVRRHRRDPRAQLLHARSLARAGQLTDAMDRFEIAYDLDRIVRGDPSFLSDLLRILQHEPLRERASALVQRAYGRRAVAAIDALLATMDEHANEAYPLRALKRRLRRGQDRGN
ncbi:MAG: protein kinase [Deltaproteobacteria bacterium]|nr:protein kinase [Deltaproteobacteria bacterium]